jgi:hypothetical protein
MGSAQCFCEERLKLVEMLQIWKGNCGEFKISLLNWRHDNVFKKFGGMVKIYESRGMFSRSVKKL